MTSYVCSELSAEGVCLAWIETQSVLMTATSEQIAESFGIGVGIILTVWSVGYAVGVAVRLARMA